MVNKLKELYDITIDCYENKDNGIIFFINDSWYYFTHINYDDNYINQIHEMVRYYYKKIPFHEFVYTKNKKISEAGYVLFKLRTFYMNINIEDILSFMVPINDKMTISMNELWQQKLDYLEDKVFSACNDEYVFDSFDYYYGIGEMILSYLRKQYIDENKFYLCHKTFYDLSSISFYNPFNVTCDYLYRDVASYISITKDYDLLKKILKEKYMSSYVYKYFFCRLCFPFYYFYLISLYLEDNKKVDIFHYSEYEDYLEEIQNIFNIYLFHFIKKRN